MKGRHISKRTSRKLSAPYGNTRCQPIVDAMPNRNPVLPASERIGIPQTYLRQYHEVRCILQGNGNRKVTHGEIMGAIFVTAIGMMFKRIRWELELLEIERKRQERLIAQMAALAVARKKATA